MARAPGSASAFDHKALTVTVPHCTASAAGQPDLHNSNKCFSQLAKENSFTKPEFASHEENSPVCSRLPCPQPGTVCLSPAALSLTEATQLLSLSMEESTTAVAGT